MSFSELDRAHMLRALALARRGEGFVEPNPMVGCVLAHGERVVGEGWHQKFGGPHAEVEALRSAGAEARGATAYVTLEPCCHHGKTPPCTEALLAAGVARVMAAQRDPFPGVAGGGFAQLAAAGVTVEVGCLEQDARALNAPYRTLVELGRPWLIAKWAMSLDGKIATRTGESRWISGEESRAVVHQLRARMDGILIGRGTAERDDPLLTARPPGARSAVRIVLASQANVSPTSQLARTAREQPVLIVAGPSAPLENVRPLEAAGCEVLVLKESDSVTRLTSLLAELGRRRLTNVLVEGGSQILGSLFDLKLIDEAHVFIAPKILGGSAAPGPLGGAGSERIQEALVLSEPIIETLGNDVYVRGRTNRFE